MTERGQETASRDDLVGEIMELLGLEPRELEKAERDLSREALESIGRLSARDAIHCQQQRIKECALVDNATENTAHRAAWTVCRHRYVREAILQIARDTNTRIELSEAAPRVREVKADLDAVSRAAQTLARLFSDEYVLAHIEDEIAAHREWISDHNLGKPPQKPPRLNLRFLSRKSDEERAAAQCELAPKLKEHSRAKAVWALNYLYPEGLSGFFDVVAEAADNINAKIPEDVGGGGTAWHQRNLSSRKRHVFECWGLFDALRPGVATTDLTNDFATMVPLVWELATDDADVSLERAIQSILGLVKDGDPSSETHAFIVAALTASVYHNDLADPFTPDN